MSHPDPNSFTRDSSGKSIPTEVFEATLTSIVYDSFAQPNVRLTGKNGAEQWLVLMPRSEVKCSTPHGQFACYPSQEFAKKFDWFTGDHVTGFLLEEDGPGGKTWFPAYLEIVLTPAQDAVLAQLQADAAQKQAQQKEQQAALAAAAERARLQQVAAWRAMKVKPPLPDEARRNRVLAEDAVKEQRFEDAVRYYEAALKVEPLWPDGQYNAALLSGELHRYASAVEHGNRYLELMPGAPDAETLRDKIIVWQEKAKPAGGGR